jgi:quinol monooxygenase YgiN
MATMLVQIKVKNFAEWKPVFNSGSELRQSNGELAHKVYQDSNDPNKLSIVYSWNSPANAQKYFGSPELKALMEKAGVQGAPSISYLNEM